LKQAVFKTDISHLQLLIVKIEPLRNFLLIAEEVVNPFQTGLGIHEIDDSHDG